MRKFKLRELNTEKCVNDRFMQRFPGKENPFAGKTAVKNASGSGRKAEMANRARGEFTSRGDSLS